jgi:uncharacterized protein YjbI with pentapeptide repeats
MDAPFELLKGKGPKGVDGWNQWRAYNADLRPDLHGARLLSAFLQWADLHDTNLDGAFLRGAHLYGANLRGASLRKAVLVGANLSKADLTAADLSGANLASCSMNEGTIVQDAVFTGCRVYGLAAWGLVGEPRDQSNLDITLDDEPDILVDNLEVAQFIYLLLHNNRVRDVIDTVTSKVVLILGRFSQQRKPVLDAIREELRRRNLVPVLFDFDRPSNKDLTGTVETLARLARFIIADLTDPSSVPHELATVVPFLRTTPVIPLKLAGSQGYSMFDDLERSYPWVSKPYEYKSIEALISTLPDIVGSADVRVTALRAPLSRELKGRTREQPHEIEEVKFSGNISPELEQKLRSALAGFHSYLSGLFPSRPSSLPSVRVGGYEHNAHFDGAKNEIVLSELVASDTYAIFRQYCHFVLLAARDSKAERSPEMSAVESGLADYFCASYGGDPRLGAEAIAAMQHKFGGDAQYIRNLANDRRFERIGPQVFAADAGEVWGGAFWDLCIRLGAPDTDRLLARSWREMPGPATHNFGTRFVEALITAARGADPATETAIVSIFEKRGLNA